MKAKEYVIKYKELGADEDALVSILEDFVREADVLLKARNCKSTEAFLSVFRELRRKWQALSELEPDIPETGFDSVIKTVLPETYEILLRHKVLVFIPG